MANGTDLLALAVLFAEHELWSVDDLRGLVKPTTTSAEIEFLKMTDMCYENYKCQSKEMFEIILNYYSDNHKAPSGFFYKCIPYWGSNFWDHPNKRIFILTHAGNIKEENNETQKLAPPIYIPIIEKWNFWDAYNFGKRLDVAEKTGNQGNMGYGWPSYMNTWIRMNLLFTEYDGQNCQPVTNYLALAKNLIYCSDFFKIWKSAEFTRSDFNGKECDSNNLFCKELIAKELLDPKDKCSIDDLNDLLSDVNLIKYFPNTSDSDKNKAKKFTSKISKNTNSDNTNIKKIIEAFKKSHVNNEFKIHELEEMCIKVISFNRELLEEHLKDCPKRNMQINEDLFLKELEQTSPRVLICCGGNVHTIVERLISENKINKEIEIFFINHPSAKQNVRENLFPARENWHCKENSFVEVKKCSDTEKHGEFLKSISLLF